MPGCFVHGLKLVVLTSAAVLALGCSSNSQITAPPADAGAEGAGYGSNKHGRSGGTPPATDKPRVADSNAPDHEPNDRGGEAPIIDREQVTEIRPELAEPDINDAVCQSHEECSESGIGLSTGTAFFVSEDGYALTNQHVVDGAIKIGILIEDELVEAELIDQSTELDLALLKIPSTTQALAVDFALVAKGEDVSVLGYPNIGIQGNEQKATFGYINAHSGIQNDERYYQMSAPIQPGNSGSPMLNISGHVVGVVTSTINPLAMFAHSGALAQNVNYALKSEYAVEMLSLVPTLRVADREKRELGKAEVVAEAEGSIVLVVVYTEGGAEDFAEDGQLMPAEPMPEEGALPGGEDIQSGEPLAEMNPEVEVPGELVPEALPEASGSASTSGDATPVPIPERRSGAFRGIYQIPKSREQ